MCVDRADQHELPRLWSDMIVTQRHGSLVSRLVVVSGTTAAGHGDEGPRSRATTVSSARKLGVSRANPARQEAVFASHDPLRTSRSVVSRQFQLRSVTHPVFACWLQRLVTH